MRVAAYHAVVQAVLAVGLSVVAAELAAHITARHHIIDVNGWPELRNLPATYEGFCW